MSAFLDPVNSRRHLLDMVRPPVGYKLEAAIGTTYSLELPVLLAVLIEMAGQSQDAMEDEATGDEFATMGGANPKDVADSETMTGSTHGVKNTFEVSDLDLSGNGLKGAGQGLSSLIAVKKLQNRVKVFTHRSGIKSLRRINNVTTILDQFIEEVHVPGNAAFHPKVWLLAYKHKEKEKLFHRLICMSRNLSSAKQHEIGVILEESTTRRSGYILPELALFLSKLSTSTEGHVAEMISRILNREVRFASPVDGWKPAFFFQEPGKSDQLLKHLPEQAGKTLVVSPFVTKGMLDILDDRLGKKKGGTLSLVSNANELRKLGLDSINVHGQKTTFLALDHASLAHLTQDDGMLHAKLLLHESPAGKELIIGSANWTNSAWRGNNWEAIVKLTGPADDREIQVDDLLNHLINIGVAPFTPSNLTEKEKDRIKAEKLASAWLAVIAGLKFNGEWRNKEGGKIILHLKIEGGNTEVEGMTGTFRPFPHGSSRNINELATTQEFEFELRGELARSKFLEFEIKIEIGTAQITKSCLMLMEIRETPQEREQRIDRIIASYLSDPDKFWDALMHILVDDELSDKGGGGLPTSTYRGSEYDVEMSMFPFTELHLELLLEACYDDEDKVRAINSVVDGAKAAPDKERYPEWKKIESFITLWNLIVEAREGITHGTKAVSTKVRGLDREATFPSGRGKRATKSTSGG